MKNEYDNLCEAISLLKKKNEIERNLLKEYFRDVQESLKPINLIKGLFGNLNSMPLKGNSLVDALIGIGTGYLSKSVFVGGSHNIFKKGLGLLLQQGVSNLTINNADSIKNFVEKAYKSFFNKESSEKMKASYK